MINLIHLPLDEIAKTHRDGIIKWVSKRLDSIFILHRELYKVKDSPIFPTLHFAKFKNKWQKEVITSFSASFAKKDLIKEKYLILRYLKIYLRPILVGTPATLHSISATLDVFFDGHRHVIDGKTKYDAEFEDFVELIKFVFDYRKFTSISNDPQVWDAYALAKKLSVNVCPYCNRLYTNTIIRKNGEKIIRPEFDHFYPKSYYPYLSVSFYNLVPSCSICNSTLKGNTKMDIYNYPHPYLEGYENELRFITGITVDDFLQRGNLVCKIQLTQDPHHPITPLTIRATNARDLFFLEDIYDEHNDIACEIFRKSTESSKEYIEKYWTFETKKGSRLFASPEELYQSFVGNFMTQKEFYKRPLAKFQYDIAYETQLIKLISSLNL